MIMFGEQGEKYLYFMKQGERLRWNTVQPQISEN